MQAIQSIDQEPRLRISYSQMFTYLGCSLKYRFQYVERLPQERKSMSLFFGSCLHSAIERFYNTYKKKGEYEPLNVLQQLFEHLLTLELEQVDVPIIYKKEAPDNASAIELGKSLIKTFHESVDLGGFEVVDAELPLRAKLYSEEGMDTGFELYGILDLLLRETNGQDLVVDNKTAAKPKSQKDVDGDLQMTTYSYLLAANRFVRPVDGVRCRMDVLRKLKKPKLSYYWTERSAQDRKRFAKLAGAVLAGIDNQVFIPHQSWLCVDCPYTKACQAW
jgi:putative RecB family exonuclease